MNGIVKFKRRLWSRNFILLSLGQSTPPSDLARKDNRVLIGKDYQARDEKEIIIQASALDYMKYVDRYTNATNLGYFKIFSKVFLVKKNLGNLKIK